jgi:hypothetical protein
MREFERVRRRDGASRWGLCRDLELPNHYLETFIVSSWAEHLRQHDRVTRADKQVEDRLRACVNMEPRVPPLYLSYAAQLRVLTSPTEPLPAPGRYPRHWPEVQSAQLSSCPSNLTTARVRSVRLSQRDTIERRTRWVESTC